MTQHDSSTPAGRRGDSHGGRPGPSTRLRLPLLAGLVLALGVGAGSQVLRDSDAGSADAADGTPEEVQVLGGDLVAGVPSIQRVVHDDAAVTLTVGPATPGENVVRIDLNEAAAGGHGGGHGSDHGSDEVRVGSAASDATAARAVPGTDGLWARVDLAEGSDEVVVTHGGVDHTFRVVTGESGAAGSVSPAWAGADAPECLSAAIGTLAADERPAPGTCPSDALAADEADTLAETVTTLASRGVERLAVHADDSARGAESLDVVREAARGAGVRVVGADAPAAGRTALLDVAGWQPSAESLADVSRLPVTEQPIRSDGTWLAPWLLSRGVVDSTAGAVLPLDFDIRSDEAAEYTDTLRALLPGQAPTASGYAAWAEARDARPGDVQLYAASRASVVMSEPGLDGSGGHEHHITQISWFPGGTITPIGTLAAAASVPTARS